VAAGIFNGTNGVTGPVTGVPVDPFTGLPLQFVDLGTRAGVDRILFVRVDTDPVLQTSPRPVVVSYPEVVVSNGVPVRQTVSRTISVPDLIFGARDINVLTQRGPPAGVFIPPTYSNNGNSGAAGNIGGFDAEGPGNIQPGGGYVFNKVGPYLVNARETDESSGFTGFVYGSFDGTTNSPVVFPVGARLSDLEAAVRRRN
jgi:hypothetical protein